MQSIKRLLIGQPIDSEHASHQKLSKILALPIFASDALSSVAYASEEIMAALLLAGSAFLYLTPRVSVGIVILLTIVAISYRQTVMAYPGGGGAYIVARDNLGELPAQAAGAALLVDYILTVSVSVAAGIAAIASLLSNYGHTMTQTEIVVVCVACVLFIALMNLRGVKESGTAFALPTYAFIFMMYLLLGFGFYKHMSGTLHPTHTLLELHAARVGSETAAGGASPLLPFGIFLLLHAFASGCTALTGVEAISNGVPAFRPPESKNAATTMAWMAAILGTVFLGMSYLAINVHALPSVAVLPGSHDMLQETVVSQVGRAVFGKGPLYLVLQIATCLILVLAANTSFADFPRLSAIMARDGFLPRQFSNIGDKLVYDRGIIVLTGLSLLLIVLFRGSVDALIPLYAIGVFLSFTLSQAGMVRRWFKLKVPGWHGKAMVNGAGAVCTCVVTIVFGIVKFSHGAWVVILLIPMLIAGFSKIHAHYRSVARQLSLDGYRPQQGQRQHMLVLVPDIHRGVIPALQYARALSPDVKAIHVATDAARENRLKERFVLWSRGIPLVILPSPYRSLTEPLLVYIDKLLAEDPASLVTVVIPEFVPTGWLPNLLHGHAGFMLALRLHNKRRVVVINVPYHIDAFVELEAHAYTADPHDHGGGSTNHGGGAGVSAGGAGVAAAQS